MSLNIDIDLPEDQLFTKFSEQHTDYIVAILNVCTKILNLRLADMLAKEWNHE